MQIASVDSIALSSIEIVKNVLLKERVKKVNSLYVCNM